MSYTDTIIGSTAIYQCTSPLQLSVQSTPNILYERNCTNEGWTGEAPNCSKTSSSVSIYKQYYYYHTYMYVYP